MQADEPVATACAADVTAPAPRRDGGRRWWPAAKQTLTLVLLGAVLFLLVRYARSIDWREVLAALRAYPLHTLAAAAACGAASHLVYTTYDLIARRQVGHHLKARKVAAIAFVSYAFNLSLGPWVGAVAMRYRLYSRLGLSVATITEVLALSLVTNWLGYLILAGAVFVFHPIALPGEWIVGSGGLRIVGAVFLALAGTYLVLCFAAPRRHWALRGRAFTLPSGRVALMQALVSCANWLFIAGVIAALLAGRAGYAEVLNVLLIAAVAGVISHVPAGIGVVEAVFLVLLSPPVPEAALIAALFGYRAIYYLAPLALAALVFLFLEAQTRRLVAAGTAACP